LRFPALSLAPRCPLAGELPCACWLWTCGVRVRGVRGAGALPPLGRVGVVPAGAVVVGVGVALVGYYVGGWVGKLI